MSSTSCSTLRERTRSSASWSANSMISATSCFTFLAVSGADRFNLASSFFAIAVITKVSYLQMLPSSTFWKPNAAYDRLENAARKAIRVFASNWKEAISRRGSLDASGLFPVSRHDHHAAALRAAQQQSEQRQACPLKLHSVPPVHTFRPPVRLRDARP